MRTRHDVAGLTLGNASAAVTDAWHPVLDTYARGVALMRERDEQGAPDSWLWAANTHGIDPRTAPRPAWDQCAHGSRFFLPWHRAYLAWFEGTIRRLTGEDDWGLPYWDYSDPALDETRALPVEFGVETRTVDGEVVSNPLFVPGRSADPLPEQDVDLVRTLAETRFVRPVPRVGFGGADRDGFFGDVENQPHNFVHMDIGGIMQSPATAAGDPVFWLHHANIDRLWEVWRGLEGSVALTDPGAAPALLVTQWRSAMFAFGDERSPTTYTTADTEDLASAAMGYAYESTDLPPDVAAAVEQARGVEDPGGGMALDDTEPSWDAVGATFDVTDREDREVAFTAGRRGLDDDLPSQLVLELAGARATNPHTAYVVEVRATPEGAPHAAGRFSTFGLAGTPETEERSYLVDATDVLPDLVAEGWAGGALTVRLVPEAGRADADDTDRSITVRQVTVYLPAP